MSAIPIQVLTSRKQMWRSELASDVSASQNTG